MIFEFQINGKRFKFDSASGIDLSMPMLFNSDQPNSYNVPIATAKAYEDGNFIGDTRRGSGCNFEEYRLIPHCNGTHTECVGHISLERISIHRTLNNYFIPSTLITVSPILSSHCNDRYDPPLNDTDLIITKSDLQKQLDKAENEFLDGLIIRTSPNDTSKMIRRYMDLQPPFFSMDAMEYIISLGIDHLMVDIPSLDRTFDEGKLSCHHIYWGVPQGNHDVNPHNHSLKTVTEMIYVPNAVPDGKYIANIQIAPFVADASPSRVVVFSL